MSAVGDGGRFGRADGAAEATCRFWNKENGLEARSMDLRRRGTPRQRYNLRTARNWRRVAAKVASITPLFSKAAT